jgi:hypothetical protein
VIRRASDGPARPARSAGLARSAGSPRPAASRPLPPIRVRREPPTLEEAVFAAQGLTDAPDQQVEIAAGLMGVPPTDVLPVLAALRARPPAAPRTGPQVVVLKRRTIR